jgi:hypothetical protein
VRLVELGYSRVAEYAGGLAEWRETGGLIESNPRANAKPAAHASAH